MVGVSHFNKTPSLEALYLRAYQSESGYLHGHSALTALRRELASWFGRYNSWRPHEHLGNLTASMVYERHEAAA